MTKRMLINASQPEQIRIALVEDNWLYDLDIEAQESNYQKANIYKGKITRIEQSLEAAFVDYGGNRHGFLPFREVVAQYSEEFAGKENLSIQDVVSVGQEIMVQIDKEERGNKGAALTTSLCLAGCYVVLMPNNPKAGGISRRVENEEREELKEIIRQLNVPEGMGLIVRTAGVGRNIEELQWDLNVLLAHWTAIETASKQGKAPFLIYRDSDIIARAIREQLKPDFEEVIIDNTQVYRNFCDQIQMIKPDMINRIKLYNDNIPLFTRHEVDSQIDSAFRRDISLPSGGSIVIDNTEALVSIDINSAKATKGGDIEQTATQTNLEAADEIARQLRLRDVGGLIVIDFIDMSSNKNQRQVESRLRDALAVDRARIQIGRISKFGLLEMSRQRLKSALADSHAITCPRCSGQGMIYSNNNMVLSVLRAIEGRAMNNKNHVMKVELPIDILTHIVNEKRTAIAKIEKRHNVRVVVIPNPELQNPHYNLDVLQMAADTAFDSIPVDTQKSAIDYDVNEAVKATPNQKPAVNVEAIPQAPMHVEKRESLIKKIWNSLVGEAKKSQSKRASGKKPYRGHNKNRRRNKNQQRQNQASSGNNRGKPQRNNSQGNESKSTAPSGNNRNRKNNRRYSGNKRNEGNKNPNKSPSVNSFE